MSASCRGMRLCGLSAYVPEQAWSNARVAARLRLERMRLAARSRDQERGVLDAEHARLFETSDRWVRRFIGFTGRRFSCDREGTVDLAARAARLLFERSGRAADEVDAIVVGSVTPSYLYSPPDAALLQHELGIPVWRGPAPREITGADVSLACSSWVSALATSYALIRSGMAERVLLIGADRMSATINWRDRSFATVLGDAGTATLCEAVPEAEDWFAPAQFWGWLDGSRAEIIRTPAGGSRHPWPTPEEIARGEQRLSMDGAEVRKVMVPFMSGPAVDAALEKAGWRLEDLDLVTLHEANLVLNAAIHEQWRTRGFRGEVLSAGGRFGNTTSASIPLALALNADRLAAGKRFGLFAYGGGLSANFALGTLRQALPAWSNVESAAAAPDPIPV